MKRRPRRHLALVKILTVLTEQRTDMVLASLRPTLESGMADQSDKRGKVTELPESTALENDCRRWRKHLPLYKLWPCPLFCKNEFFPKARHFIVRTVLHKKAKGRPS